MRQAGTLDNPLNLRAIRIQNKLGIPINARFENHGSYSVIVLERQEQRTESGIFLPDGIEKPAKESAQ